MSTWKTSYKNQHTELTCQHISLTCQNTSPTCQHRKPVRAQLHRLPIRTRVTFKIATMVFKKESFKSATMVLKIRRNHQPSYFADLIEEYKPQQTLRSSSQLLLKERTFQTVTDCRSFRYVAVKTWISLPETSITIDTIESFRRQMKAMSFRQSYCM